MRYQEPTNIPLTDAMVKRLIDVLETGIYTNGKYVAEFEKQYKSIFDLKGQCVAVNGCQSGLMLCLTALHVNRCLIPDFTFSATANAVYWACKGIVTGDCDLHTFNLKPKLPKDVDGVVPTHIFGNPCDCRRWKELTEPELIPLIYDAAHAHGASYDSIPIGDHGTASVFSLSPTKQVTSAEGGMVVTQDKSLADRLRKLRNYGTEYDYEQNIPGLNARMSEFHAILGLESLSRFWVHYRHRLSLVEAYLGAFDSEMVQRPNPKGVHAWKDFSVILGKDRDLVRGRLRDKGIESKSYFRPVSTLGSYAGSTERQKNSCYLYESILQLPLHGNMSTRDVEQVVGIVNDVTPHPHPHEKTHSQIAKQQ